MPLDDLTEQESNIENNNEKVNNYTEKVDTLSKRFDAYNKELDTQPKKNNIPDEYNEKIDISIHETPIINYQDSPQRSYTDEELDNYTRKINHYMKKRMDYVLKEAYQKNYEEYLEEQDLKDSMEAEKRKQRIKKETIILYMIQKTKEMQGYILATFEQIQRLIKNFETAMGTLKSILNLIANPHLKKIFKKGIKFIKKFNEHLRNNDIILTENDYRDMEEKSTRLISETERFRNSNSTNGNLSNSDVVALIEVFCALINSMFMVNEKMLMLVNQERPSVYKKIEMVSLETFEHVPPMEESKFVKTFKSGNVPPQEFENEDIQRKNS